MTTFVEKPVNKHSIANRRRVCGVGTNDAVYRVNVKVDKVYILCLYYRVWLNMIHRCYSEKSSVNQPTYINCIVCDEWLRSFMAFKTWMEKQDWQGKVLDKDILVPGNKIYSPETCIFVSHKVNSLLLDRKAARGPHPQGVSFCKASNNYEAMCHVNGRAIHLGRYSDVKGARDAYVLYKKNVIASVAEKQTDSRLACALHKWSAEYEILK